MPWLPALGEPGCKRMPGNGARENGERGRTDGEGKKGGRGRRCPLLPWSVAVDGGGRLRWKSDARPQLRVGDTVVELGGGLLSGNGGAGGGGVGML